MRGLQLGDRLLGGHTHLCIKKFPPPMVRSLTPHRMRQENRHWPPTCLTLSTGIPHTPSTCDSRHKRWHSPSTVSYQSRPSCFLLFVPLQRTTPTPTSFVNRTFPVLTAYPSAMSSLSPLLPPCCSPARVCVVLVIVSTKAC